MNNQIRAVIAQKQIPKATMEKTVPGQGERDDAAVNIIICRCGALKGSRQKTRFVNNARPDCHRVK